MATIYKIIILFTLCFNLNANDIRMAWDFRDNKWKTVEFITGKTNSIRVYTTAEDVTELVIAKRIDGEVVFSIVRREYAKNNN